MAFLFSKYPHLKMSGTLKKTKKLITMRLVMVLLKKFGGNVLIMDTNGKQVFPKDV